MTDYPRPSLTVDCVVFDGWNRLLLIKRGKEPFVGRWALPGGFVNEGESVEEAAARELKEETGLALSAGGRTTDLKLVRVYSEPGRDPRGWVVSVAFCADVQDLARSIAVRGMDDAAEAQWVNLSEIRLEELAFDHGTIVHDSALRFGRRAGIDIDPRL